MKPTNLRNGLSKYFNKKIRVRAIMTMLSKPHPTKPRTVLLTKVYIDNALVLDHIWVPYNTEWGEYSHTDNNQEFTFLTTVVKLKKNGLNKFVFGKISKLQTTKDFSLQKRKPSDAEVINPESKKLKVLLPASCKVVATLNATVEELHESSVTLSSISIDGVLLEYLEIPLTEHQMRKVSKFKQISASAYLVEDLKKEAPYQPVYVLKVKNLEVKEV